MNYQRIRRKTTISQIGKLKIGGEAPISVQSMTSCNVKDYSLTVQQIKKLESAGCDLIRIAFPDIESCKMIPLLKKITSMPLMGDIHFDPRIALSAINNGIDGIRINPGNIRKESQWLSVINAAKNNNVMIRFGINSGSIDKTILAKYPEPDYKALIEETENLLEFLEKIDYKNIVISIKSSNVIDTIIANQVIASKCDYPLHLGVTEAGFGRSGVIKSAIGIGTLLFKGIGDTIRVSLSGDPEDEVLAGHDILSSLEIKKRGVNIISCPTCGRCEVDIYKIASEIENKFKKIKKPITIAIMGCVVNGPGEAKSADIGIAFNKKEAMIFKKGEMIKRLNYTDSDYQLVSEIQDILSKTIQKEG
ncbi:MAG: flavodoxin-dependent (E)-4-hydroxy-3-methylbut-2-enyl-diphosphate synthase [Atribacterota bacterium]|nr:flavodoxin-dependent (E)-4-hydroxy-3-methylbut-2-enyl-diphosphate synthase [Atribacterota bacterium]